MRARPCPGRAMPTAPVHLRDADLVVHAFGYWPSFHDSGLREVRRTDDGALTLTLHAFEMTSEVDARGYFVLTKHHRIRLRFEDVTDGRLAARDDTVSRLSISDERDADGRFLVEVESAVGSAAEGYGGTFRARAGAVVQVTATPAGDP